VVGRPRPQGPAFGFPSGHVTAVAAFGVILLYVATRARVRGGVCTALVALAIVGPVAVGAARLLLDAHWLSDVVGGGLLGASCATAAAWWDASHPRALHGGGERRLAPPRTI
jgi:undecaprenyl-diphosphatase